MSYRLNSFFLPTLYFIFLGFASWGLMCCLEKPSKDKAPGFTQITPVAKAHYRKDSCEQLIIAYLQQGSIFEGVLYGLERNEDKWIATFDTVPCTFGKKGLAELNKKIEGDGKTPVGMFPIGSAFGYENDLNCATHFIELSDNHYWISASDHPMYNRLVEYAPSGVYAEKMKRKDHLYKYGIIIEYNMQPVEKGKGSAIFIHVERKPGAPTAGCIAVSEKDMKQLIKWIKPGQHAHILIGSRALVDSAFYRSLPRPTVPLPQGKQDFGTGYSNED